MGMQTNGDLDIHFDLAWERKEWRVQRAAWILFALILGSALAGVFGPGPISRKEKRAGGLSAKYAGITRCQSPAEIEFNCQSAKAGEELRLQISRSFIDAVENIQFIPEPVEQKSTARGHEYVFKNAGDGAAKVRMHYEPAKFGKAAGTVSLGDGPSLELKQFIWP